MKSESIKFTEQGVLTLSHEDWDLARKRTDIIAPIAALETVGHQAADEAAQQLGVSRRQVYFLIQRFREGTGLLTDLAPKRSSGGKGKGRLPETVETIIRELIRKQFMKRQKPTMAKLYRDVKKECKVKGLSVPARNSVALRIKQLNPVQVIRAREGVDAARSLQSAGDTPPTFTSILEQVQIDHTVIDLIIVDERDRQPIGRPYLTIAIDVFSRCIVGMVVTLEPPSTVSVGLCMAHMVCDKRPWLEQLKLEVDWPMSGKPRSLYLDNAAEFKSEALRRGCELHGISLNYRPPGKPHYGGIIERLIGIMMEEVHDLPGTTFSNPEERGDYDSEKMAALTLHELERWLIIAVAYYHGDTHDNDLKEPPTKRWEKGIKTSGTISAVSNAKAFMVDFLPIIRRTLTRTGFAIDHIHYFANALKPLIARRNKHAPKFLIRRDPRDISRIWVLDTESQNYLEIPYRSMENPAITLWEQRQAVKRLREQGRDQVDEVSLFRMIDQMREIVCDAQKATKRSRRNNERLKHLSNPVQPYEPVIPPESDQAEIKPALPFNEIEEW
ncbi:MAG: Mu transposase C-terminal domain-containing protein [Methylococcales bacterium]